MEDKIKIYVRYDNNNSIVELKSNIFLEDSTDWKEIDVWQEGQDRYIYAHADNGEYIEQKYGKPLYDELGRPNFHDDFLLWTDEEKEKLYPVVTKEEQTDEIDQLKQEIEILNQAMQDMILMTMSMKGGDE